jgi:hypothetical protein
MSNHLLPYLLTTASIQTSTPAIREAKRERGTGRPRDRPRESGAGTWIPPPLRQLTLEWQALAENYRFCNTTFTSQKN